nr:MAG TPA: hypothetical protein [Caudoviricetes sp.]
MPRRWRQPLPGLLGCGKPTRLPRLKRTLFCS